MSVNDWLGFNPLHLLWAIPLVLLVSYSFGILLTELHSRVEEQDNLDAEVHNAEYRAKYYPYHY